VALTIAVILILGVLWIAVLVPPILRARDRQGRADSVGDFTYRLRTLAHTNGSYRHRARHVSTHQPMFAPSPVGGGPTMSATQRRRRDVLLVLAGISVVTLLVAFVMRSTPFFALQLLSDIVLAGYVYLLLQHKQRMQEQRAKVRPIRAARADRLPYAAPVYARPRIETGPRLVPLRQTASN